MEKSLVSPSFLKQKARQLKKEKSLSQSQALDEMARQLGYSNYKHYLNLLEANPKNKEILLKNISSEIDMFKKADLAISFIQNFKISFNEQLDMLKLFPHSGDIYDLDYSNYSGDSDNLNAMQAVCRKLNLMEGEIRVHLLNDFFADEGKAEIHFRQPHFIAKEISLSDLAYGIDGDMLLVDGKYHLKTEFELEIDENDPISKDERFNDRELFGSFGVKIDKDKKITIVHSDIMENAGDDFFGGSFR